MQGLCLPKSVKRPHYFSKYIREYPQSQRVYGPASSGPLICQTMGCMMNTGLFCIPATICRHLHVRAGCPGMMADACWLPAFFHSSFLPFSDGCDIVTKSDETLLHSQLTYSIIFFSAAQGYLWFLPPTVANSAFLISFPSALPIQSTDILPSG